MIKLDWKSIPTSGPDLFEEFERLDYWAHLKYNEVGAGHVAVEIGSYRGRSTAILSQYFSLLSLDLFGGSDNSPFESTGTDFSGFAQTLNSFNLVDHAFPIVSSSRVLEILTPQYAQFAFVDGDHHEIPCYQDAIRCDKHLAYNGIMIFHDFQRQGPKYPEKCTDYSQFGFPGVDNAVRQFLAERPHYQVLEHFQGILVTRKLS
jgi:hypothetical protein